MSEPNIAYGYNIPTHTGNIAAVIGMNKKEFKDIKNEEDYIVIIREGLPKTAMTHLMEITDLTLTEMALITHTSDRTLRRYEPQQKLSPEQSERMIELARLYTRGAAVLGSMDRFKQWMNTEIMALGNKKPKEFLDTSIGIGMLSDELGKIEHGIFA